MTFGLTVAIGIPILVVLGAIFWPPPSRDDHPPERRGVRHEDDPTER